jgi:hypothetical protein
MIAAAALRVKCHPSARIWMALDHVWEARYAAWMTPVVLGCTPRMKPPPPSCPDSKVGGRQDEVGDDFGQASNPSKSRRV